MALPILRISGLCFPPGHEVVSKACLAPARCEGQRAIDTSCRGSPWSLLEELIRFKAYPRRRLRALPRKLCASVFYFSVPLAMFPLGRFSAAAVVLVGMYAVTHAAVQGGKYMKGQVCHLL